MASVLKKLVRQANTETKYPTTDHQGLEEGPTAPLQAEPKPKPKPPRPALLDAFQDPVAGLSAYTPCVLTCDLFGDGSWRLVVGDEDKKLKVWNGAHKEPEHNLLDVPVAITTFSAEANAKLPELAVACGAHVYIYRNLRPYFKFVLPAEDVNAEEQGCWAQLMAGDIVVGAAVDMLTRLQEAGVGLTNRSLQVMNIADPNKKLAFVEQCQGQPLLSVSVIACMATLNLVNDEPGAASCLVLGTESGRVLILNPTGTAVAQSVAVGVAPAALAVRGVLEGSYCITVAGRDGKLYNIKNAQVQQAIIQLEAPVVGLIRVGKAIMVACMNNVIHSYKEDGRKNFSIYVPSPVVTLQRLEVVPQMTCCMLVALANGEVRMYNGKALVHTHTLPSVATALWFGRYGREENTLVTVMRSGAVNIKVVPRTAKLSAPALGSATLPEQEVPLQVPKKTRLYIEQTQREVEQAADMHRVFQHDLAKLKLTAARTYVRLLMDGKGAVASTPSANLSLKLTAHGLGPRFRLLVTVRNEGSSHASGIPVVLTAPERLYRLDTKLFTIPHATTACLPQVLTAPERLYRLDTKLFTIPLLVPTLSYTFQVGVTCIDPQAGSDTITVVMLNKAGSQPILQAQLRMPMSEMEEED